MGPVEAVSITTDQFEAVAAALPDALLLIRADGTVIAANASAHAVLQARPGGLVGASLAESGGLDADRVGHLLHRGATSATPVTGVVVRESAEGTQQGLVWELFPTGTDDQRVIVRIAHDRQRRGASSHRHRQDVLQLLEESATDLISVHTDDGDYLWASPSCRTILGYEPEELIGRPAYAFIHPDDAARIAEDSHSTILERPDVVTITYRIRRRDGSYIWFETTSRTVRDENDQVVEIIAQSRDVTARVEAHQRLERLNRELESTNRELGQLIAITSHDLQNPIGAASGFLELFLEQRGDSLDELGTELLSRAGRSLQSTSALLKDLLGYGQATTAPLREVAVDLDALLHHIADEPGRHEALITIQPLPVVLGDPSQLHQVFDNLISNAIKYVTPGVKPEVEVTAHEADDHWRIDVDDNGIGIPPDRRDSVFGIFERIHGPDNYPGTGIGLAVVQRCVERHGGRVWVEDAPGGGTRFCLTLPKLA